MPSRSLYPPNGVRGDDLFVYRHSNPIGAAFWSCVAAYWLVIHIPQGISWLGGFGGYLLGFILRFITQLFRLIHSELRLLCAVDAALGAAVGYLTGNALLGATFGGLFGVLNYEVITIRVMKLAGAKSLFR